MAGWYRRFIPNYADVTAPITNLLRKGVKFRWNDDANLAFEKLKDLLCHAPVLHNPDFTKQFYIRCDASTQGIGGVLFQLDDDDGEKPIAFISQKLNSAQRNYTVTELECLAAVLSVKQFRPYIEGYRFTIFTDHASLKWLMSQKDLSGRLARWSLKLQSYDFTIVHQKGKDNIVADTLSRIYCDSLDEIMCDEKLHDMQLFNVNDLIDEEYTTLRTRIKDYPEKFLNFCVSNDKIFIRLEPKHNRELTDIPVWKMWVPVSSRQVVIEKEHVLPESAHGGIRKTLERIRRLYYWPKMTIDVHRYVTNCIICKQTKASNQATRPPLGKLIIPLRPWQKIYIDLLGPYPRSTNGKTFIFIVLDHLTKFVYLKTLSKASAVNVIACLRNEIFSLFNVPQTIHSDNGNQFKGKEFQSLIKEYGINHVKTAYYSPQSNASERVNRSIVAAIRAYLIDKHTAWDKHLPQISTALRNSIHESTGYSPHFLLYGYHKMGHGQDYKLLQELNMLDEGAIDWMKVSDRLQIVHDEVKKNLVSAYNKYAARYNLRTRERSLNVGQIVYVKQHFLSDASKKFVGKFSFPFVKAIEKEKRGNCYYELTNETGKILGVYHIMDIKT